MSRSCHFICQRFAILALTLCLVLPADGQVINGLGVDAGQFGTALSDEDLDQKNDLEWLEGESKPAVTARDGRKRAIWTQESPSELQPITFGEGRQLGERHLRLSLKRDVKVGSVLTQGNCRLSVLKSGVGGLGDPGNESHWRSAERLEGREVVTTQPKAGHYVMWTLPPGTTTRALRLSHKPDVTDQSFEGQVVGLYIIEKRFANIAPQSQATVSTNSPQAPQLIDETDASWSNGNEGGLKMLSTSNPQWIQLTFPEPVSIAGLNALAGSLRDVDVRVLPASIKAGQSPSESDWQDIRSFQDLASFYPSRLNPSMLDLGKAREVRAVRLSMTASLQPGDVHPHLKRQTAEGKRVWLEELQALMPLGDRPLNSAVLDAWETGDAHPPIPVRFTLDQPGNVTLVIDDADGKRVRNLVSETPFEAGENVVWWDGLDDLGRDTDAAKRGVYHVPGSLVEAGTYTVRGLVTPPIELTYEISIDQAGTPPWPTPDGLGTWGTNHTPPSCVAICPPDRNELNEELVFVGSYVAEGGHGLFWIDLEGKKKGGLHWLGGIWTGAQTVAVDQGKDFDKGVAVYVVSGFQGEVRFVALDRKFKEKALGTFRIAERKKGNLKDDAFVGDIAVHDRLIVAAMPNINAVWLFDEQKGGLIGKLDIDSPNALGFKPDGTLLASSGERLLEITLDREAIRKLSVQRDATKLPLIERAQMRVLNETLVDARDIAVLDDGRLAITEAGEINQVRLYDSGGRQVGAVGKAGKLTTGPYDPDHLNRPDGVAVDSRGRFWVAENFSQPKRVSLWSPSGELVEAWYGPSRYGGGGTLDPYDKNLFYNAGMQFRIDWNSGEVSVERILVLDASPHGNEVIDAPRPQFPTDQHHSNGMPEQAHRVDGRKFLSSWHNGAPVTGTRTAVIWEDDGDKVTPVAAIGDAYDWWITESDEFKHLWPEGTPHNNKHVKPVHFFWQDTNGDGICDPDETTLHHGKVRGIAVQADLTIVCSLDKKLVKFDARVGSSPVRYDFANPVTLMDGVQSPASSGGETYLLMPDDRVVMFPPPEPMSRWSVGGGPVGGEPDWSYPNMWPGLHASHEAAMPEHPGMVIGLTRTVGLPITPRGSDLGPLWLINSNMGNTNVFTSDGLFVAQLLGDVRVAKKWRMPVAERGMRVDHMTVGQETFWTTATQVQDTGEIFLSVGPSSVTSLIQVHGLEKARRLESTKLTVDKSMLQECLAWQSKAEAERSARVGPKQLRVSVSNQPVTLDGKLDEWQDADWATIDQRGRKGSMGAKAKAYDAHAAMRVVGDTLYVAWRTNEDTLLSNSGEMQTAPFKTGGALDLMIGASDDADQSRTSPAEGDQRLLITRIDGGDDDGELMAVHYQAVVPGTSEQDRVAFTSPVHTIFFDKVTDVSTQIKLAQQDGHYEASIPLSLLGLNAKSGLTLRGDVGLLRGSRGATQQRVYWSNKATGIIADVPAEARLQPELWGELIFEH